jgi:hypothetical protein
VPLLCSVGVRKVVTVCFTGRTAGFGDIARGKEKRHRYSVFVSELRSAFGWIGMNVLKSAFTLVRRFRATAIPRAGDLLKWVLHEKEWLGSRYSVGLWKGTASRFMQAARR